MCKTTDQNHDQFRPTLLTQIDSFVTVFTKKAFERRLLAFAVRSYAQFERFPTPLSMHKYQLKILRKTAKQLKYTGKA